MVFRSLLDSIIEKLQVTKRSPSPLVKIVMDETAITVSSEPLALQTGVNISTILQMFEDQHVLYAREVQEAKSVTQGKLTVRRSERKDMASLAAITKAIKRQVLVAAGASSKAVQPLPPTAQMEEDALDTSIPAPHVGLSENARTEFATNSNVMKAVCSIHARDFWQLTESFEKQTAYTIFRNVVAVPTNSP